MLLVDCRVFQSCFFIFIRCRVKACRSVLRKLLRNDTFNNHGPQGTGKIGKLAKRNPHHGKKNTMNFKVLQKWNFVYPSSEFSDFKEVEY